MPRYYFDIHDNIHVNDSLGQDLADLEAAKTEAVRIAGGFATRNTVLGKDGGAVSVVVRTGPSLTAMTIRLVLNVEMRPE